MLTKDKTINKSITVTVNMEHIDESYPPLGFAGGHVLGNAPATKYKSQSGGDKYMTLKVELSDYVHTVKSKIASKILEAKHRWMASWSHKIVKKMEDKELKKGWNLYTPQGTHLQDYFTLADYDIENNPTICFRKDRVFGTKWVDVGNEVPRSLIEIICPELAKLLAKEDKGGIVDLEHSEKVKAVEEKLAKAREDVATMTRLGSKQPAAAVARTGERSEPLSQNHCIRADNGRYDDMIT